MGTLVEAARELPPLLKLLELRVRDVGHGAKGRRKIPIDADALDIAEDVRKTLREWASQVRSLFHADNLTDSFANWYRVFLARFVQGCIPESKLEEATIVVEGWVNRIRTKFDPPETREWKSPCPKCGELKIPYLKNGEQVYRYAVTLDVTNVAAQCGACGEQFTGPDGLALLRLLANVSEQLASGVKPEPAAYQQYLEYQRGNGVSRIVK